MIKKKRTNSKVFMALLQAEGESSREGKCQGKVVERRQHGSASKSKEQKASKAKEAKKKKEQNAEKSAPASAPVCIYMYPTGCTYRGAF